jgi:sec-independent protein translocase protein TatA
MPFSAPAELFGEQGIIVLVVVALVLFGSTQIPKLARSLGSAQREFKKGVAGSPSDDLHDPTTAEAIAAPGLIPVRDDSTVHPS